MIAITIMSSMRVKPFCIVFMVLLQLNKDFWPVLGLLLLVGFGFRTLP